MCRQGRWFPSARRTDPDMRVNASGSYLGHLTAKACRVRLENTFSNAAAGCLVSGGIPREQLTSLPLALITVEPAGVHSVARRR